ncbi:hybrid sensor histidine kinase/response regulator transcription factor [Bacteroides sp. 3_1_13]|uniref:hybrid sensor histidine kinase/response regulator transcription factor n=1 Tax=Bacteroides sp. 3_1_13 TaxID=457389 RepID=UPI000672240D|nr:hybrid sensor histidine kinase/response regulator transcription factor [Bacteroides sp. 3_1_13]KMW82545.1 hypothetical protein HMPREF9009_00132 [Bacteroides sp. 3_1_13]
MKSINVRRFLLTGLFLYTAMSLCATIHYNNLRFKQFETLDKLPHKTINAITQDNSGFLWLGTRNGLCRYDGYNIVTYQYHENDSNSLCHNFVNTLYNDSLQNVIWIATEEGICKYSSSTGRFVRYRIEGNTKPNVVFLKTFDKQLLAGCSNGVYAYDEKKDAFVPFLLTGTEASLVSGLAEDHNGFLWISTPKGAKCYNMHKKVFMKLPESVSHISSKLYIDKFNRLWYNMNQQVNVYDINNQQNYSIKESKQFKIFKSIALDGMDNIWLGSEYGIFVYGKDLRLIHHYQQTEGDLSNLNDNPIYSLFMDANHNMWVGTYFGGVNCYIDATDNFHVFSYGNSRNHLSGKAVRQITGGPDEDIYTATEDGGLNRIDKSGQITRSEALHQRMDIGATNVHSLLLNHEGDLWIGLYEKGARCYNFRTQHTKVFLPMDLYRRHSGFCMIEDAEHDIWYGGLNGFVIFRKEGKGYEVMKFKKPFLKFIFCMVNAPDGTVWAGTRRDGVFRLDKRKQTVERIATFPNKELFITDLYVDSQNQIWVGTDDNGMLLLNSKGEYITSYTEEQIGSNSIKGIVEDNAGNIWFGTVNGLCCIRAKGGIMRYTTEDGLPTNQFNYSSAYKDARGVLYFGTINGLVSFHPERIYKYPSRFNIALTAISLNGELINPSTSDSPLEKTISECTSITLTHKQARSVQIEYSGMNYRYNNNTMYAMKLEGVDKKWQNIGEQHQVRFSNLPAGHYRLRIKAGEDGIHWYEKGEKIINIRVLPPFWLSGWAYGFYAVCLLMLGYIGYRYTKNRLRLVMNLKTEHNLRVNMEKLNQQKINFFTYISHDLKTPLTLILSPLQRLLSQKEITNHDKKNIEIIYRNANQMKYLIDELLSFSKIEMNQEKINVRKGNIMLFLKELSNIFEIVARDREIDFIVKLDDTDEEVWFSPSKLERIMYNLLSNAFKYTAPGDYVQLTASLQEEDQQTFVHISVKDSGRGIPDEVKDRIFEPYYQVSPKDHREGFGLGLSLTKSLIQLHRGRIEIESKVGEGSNFIVILNVSEQAYEAAERRQDGITLAEIQKYNMRLKETVEILPDKLTQEKHPSQEERQSILIVEDNNEMNNYLKEIFMENYQVIQTYNGKEACEVMQKVYPSLIISDVMMPVMDGLELTRRVKQDINTSHIPVILLTAKTDEGEQTQGYLCGADAYIPKPFNAKNLELLVRNMQQNRMSGIAHFKQTEELNITQITNNPRDERFMKDLVELIMANISKEDYGITEITSALCVSRSLLHTKLKMLTGCSASQFIRSIRMREAKKHLLDGMNVAEAACAVGMTDPNYFTKCFKKEFDVTPTEFTKEHLA